ncbi:MAG TPA: hypothetical protein VME70_12170 [Mycobacteriales bacterium]|nr:hypothetical protein [Mycobacteriales bacterium]
MSSIIDRSGRRDGLSVVVLRTDHVEVAIAPEAGGKILDLIDPASGMNLLWHNPRIPLSATYAGAPFDDVWCGGWDQMFPTDVPCELDGNTHHDHGDLWIGPWAWEVVSDDGERAQLRMQRHSASLPCRAELSIGVERSSSQVRVHLSLHNLGTHRMRFIWNQHIAHAVAPGSRVHLPAGSFDVAGSTPSRAGAADRVSWPVHDGLDLSRIPGPELGVTEFLCTNDLGGGWCAVTHPGVGVGVRLGFDPAVFRTPWLWGVFGGWRGHELLLTELCTSRPGSLATAVADGSAASLGPEESLATEVVVTIGHDFDPEAPGDEDPFGG